MTPSDIAAFHIMGAILMALGIVVFLISRATGDVTIEFLGQRLHLGAPSLFVLIAGVFLFVFPHTSLVRREEETLANVASVNEVASNDAALIAEENVSAENASDDQVVPYTPVDDVGTIRREGNAVVVYDSIPPPPVSAGSDIADPNRPLDQQWVDEAIGQGSTRKPVSSSSDVGR